MITCGLTETAPLPSTSVRTLSTLSPLPFSAAALFVSPFPLIPATSLPPPDCSSQIRSSTTLAPPSSNGFPFASSSS